MPDYTFREVRAQLPPSAGNPFPDSDNVDEEVTAWELIVDGVATGRFVFSLWPYDDAPYGWVDAGTELANWHCYGYDIDSEDDDELDRLFAQALATAKADLTADYERNAQNNG